MTNSTMDQLKVGAIRLLGPTHHHMLQSLARCVFASPSPKLQHLVGEWKQTGTYNDSPCYNMVGTAYAVALHVEKDVRRWMILEDFALDAPIGWAYPAEDHPKLPVGGWTFSDCG